MTEPAEPSSKKILIVDDDDSVRDLLEFVIRKEGFQVDKANDGQEALKHVETFNPDLVLLDLMMPKYGGFEVLRKLQTTDKSTVPIVVISGRFADKNTVEMIRQESNVVEFVEKPVRPPQILAILHRVLSTKPKSA